MFERPRRTLLLLAAAPLSIGLFSTPSARAQSIPPVGQTPSGPPPRPLPPSLPPKRAKTSDDDASNGEVDEEGGYLDGDYLTTNWGGARPWLQEHGVDLEASYTGEGFTRLHGGTGSSRPREYLGTVDASVAIDTGTLGAWSGGALNLHFKHLHGKGMSGEHIGSFQASSNLEADSYTALAEYWLRQEFLDGALAFKIGRQDANVDFAASDFAGGLINSSFGVFPTLSLTTYPNWGLGAAAFVRPTKALSLQGGVFEGTPDGKKPLGGTGFFDGDGGRLFVGEIQLHSEEILGGLPGTLRVGGWYHTGQVDAVPNAAGELESFRSNRGVYAVFDHKLYQPHGEERNSEGLGVFVQLGHAPGDRNDATLYVGAGLAYTGAIPGRPADIASIGVAHVEFAKRLRSLESKQSETVVEATYKAELTKFVSVQPNVQHIVRPGGTGSVPNATVAGLRMVANF